MKKCICILLVVFSIMLSGCGHQGISEQITDDPTALTFFDSDSTRETIAESTSFVVKGTIKNAEEYMDQSVARYLCAVDEDYLGNVIPNAPSDNEIYIYAPYGQYEIGCTYYLFLSAYHNTKLGTIFYNHSENAPVLEEDGVSEESIRNYIACFGNTMRNNTEEYITDALSMDSLEQAAAEADTITQIVITDGYEVNLDFSVCNYTIQSVLKGDLDDMELDGKNFSMTIPTVDAAYGNTFYMLQSKKLDINGYNAYEPLCDDYWLIPVDSAQGGSLANLFELN